MMLNIYEFHENQGSKDHIFLDINEITFMHVVWNLWYLESKEYLGKYVYYTTEHTICHHVKYSGG
jgi:hypothetical protein